MNPVGAVCNRASKARLRENGKGTSVALRGATTAMLVRLHLGTVIRVYASFS